MAITDIFSKRQRRARGEVVDTYQYDQISEMLRNQVMYAADDALGGRHGSIHYHEAAEAYRYAVETLRREYGVQSLSPKAKGYYDEIVNFFIDVRDVERALDVVEILCQLVDTVASEDGFYYRSAVEAQRIADEALEEINARFKQHGLGYQFISGEIVRVDSELIHAEVVKPALRLLNGQEYAGPQEEFLAAHQHYRHGNNKEALVDCLKAFESTMKAICDKRGWERDPSATASQLIKLLFEKGLVPTFWQTQINALKSSLESAVPTGRNKLAGHGQGSEPVAVPDYLAGYMLHMTASTILFLVEAEETLQQ